MTAVPIPHTLGRLRRLDGVVVAFLLVLAALAALNPVQLRDSVAFTLDSLVGIAPFILLGVLVAAYTQAARVDTLIAGAFGGRVLPMILAAAAFGALSPFCSCGVVPIIAALLAMGIPLPAVMAFWLASPIMDPELFILTAGGLGTEFAVAKTLAAIALGLVGGFGTWLVAHAGGFPDPLKGPASGCGVASLRRGSQVRWAFWHEPERRRRFWASAGGNAWFLGKWLTLAFLLESLMLAYVPADMVGQWVGGGNALAIPLASVLGAPAYLNGYAAIPTTAALMDLGMAPGAALAFMVAGGVTSIPAAVAVFALVRWPVFLVYVGFGFGGAMLAGLAYALYLA
jgi:uncharacterized membrane protein YraQ (UPF0718 family)